MLKLLQRLLATSLVMAMVAGCGGKASSNAKVAPAPAARKKPAGVPQKPRDPAAAKQKPAAKKVSKKKGPEFDPSVDPHDIFAVVRSKPTFEIVGQVSETDDSDLFYATLPAEGTDSTTFELDPVSSSRAVGQPNPDFELPEGFVPLPEEGYSDNGLSRRIVCEKDQALMALVSSGVFLMGKYGGPAESSPELSVFLEPFYIDVTEVTVTQFESFRTAREIMNRRVPPEPLNAGEADIDDPALGVTWREANMYAIWARKSLPTEADWEKAARGADGYEHPWGNGHIVWSRYRTLDQIDSVGSFRLDMSSDGVFDLAGNAREWCKDRFAPGLFQKIADDGVVPVRNWRGPRKSAAEEGKRVVKGNGPGWVCWHRMGRNDAKRFPDVGFRCVLHVKLPE